MPVLVYTTPLFNPSSALAKARGWIAIERVKRFSLAVIVLVLAALTAGCAYSPCRKDDNSRFACDPSTVSITPLAIGAPDGTKELVALDGDRESTESLTVVQQSRWE